MSRITGGSMVVRNDLLGHANVRGLAETLADDAASPHKPEHRHKHKNTSHQSK